MEGSGCDGSHKRRRDDEPRQGDAAPRRPIRCDPFQPCTDPPTGAALCRYWARGQCTFGNQCRFAHTSSRPSSVASQSAERNRFKVDFLRKTRLCRRFESRGFCDRGALCAFAHSEGELRRRPGCADVPESEEGEIVDEDAAASRASSEHASAESSAELPCLCLRQFSRCVFLPEPDGEHAIRKTDGDGAASAAANRSAANRTLLGGLGGLCASFFHTHSDVARVRCLCLHRPANRQGTSPCALAELGGAQAEKYRSCNKTQAVVVARLRTAAGAEAYVARYANCFRGSSQANKHAEAWAIDDPVLKERLRDLEPSAPAGEAAERDGEAAPRAQLELYMTYQPCHHSGGQVPLNGLAREALASCIGRNAADEHPTSCSERLRDFYMDELAPRRIGLTCVLSDIYKAAKLVDARREQSLEASVLRSTSESAREGMELLMRAGVRLRAMRPDDWDFLLTLCDDEVRRLYESRQLPGEAGDAAEAGGAGAAEPSLCFSPWHMSARYQMDRFVAEFIEGPTSGSGKPSLAHGRLYDRLHPMLSALEEDILGSAKDERSVAAEAEASRARRPWG